MAGAALLGVALSQRWDLLVGGGAVETGVSEFSVPWFGLAFAAGLGVQLLRHAEELDPRSGDATIEA